MTKETVFYLYKITNKIDNKIYIGCHQTKNINDGYMGSGKHIKRAVAKYGTENFIKEVLSLHTSANEMYDAEANIVTKEFASNLSTYNIAEGGRGGYRGECTYKSTQRSDKIRNAHINKASVMDIFGNKSRVDVNDPRLLSKELVGITKGKRVVKDKDGNTFQVSTNDPRFKSGELVGHTKGFSLMKDKHGNKSMVPCNDPMILSGELVGHTKGSIQSDISNKKRSETLKGRQVAPTRYASCIYCKKTQMLTNIIRWHKNCS